ncbi:DUF2065 domain-containing protein [bacterium]|jgi:uncharacterized protein YjeT (DUF2065 family)|nr:MAG: DUF2065 domain-containing protein [bacterium]
MSEILTILGALLILEGIPYFTSPKKAKEWALSVQDIPSGTLRIIGLVSMAMGLAFIYVKRFF